MVFSGKDSMVVPGIGSIAGFVTVALVHGGIGAIVVALVDCSLSSFLLFAASHFFLFMFLLFLN